jgi:hypothetical protein
MRSHEYKTHPHYFERIVDGSKPFEVRRDDRPERPEPGDILVLREYNPSTLTYTGRLAVAEVTYIMVGATGKDAGIRDGWFVVGINVFKVGGSK